MRLSTFCGLHRDSEQLGRSSKKYQKIITSAREGNLPSEFLIIVYGRCPTGIPFKFLQVNGRRISDVQQVSPVRRKGIYPGGGFLQCVGREYNPQVSFSPSAGNIIRIFPSVHKKGTFPIGFHQCAGRKYTPQVSTSEQEWNVPSWFPPVRRKGIYPAGFHQ